MSRREETPLCNHVKANGTVCESPALKGKDFCFFHTDSRERAKRQRRAAQLKLPFQLPLLEDANSIQLAIGDTLNALLAGQIDHKTAGLVLYGLQTAAGNIRHTSFEVYRSDRHVETYEEAPDQLTEQPIIDKPASESAATPRIVATTAAAKPSTKSALPPKKAIDKELLDVACEMAMERARAIKKQFQK